MATVRALARVDLGAISANCARLAALAPLCAVVKADGYGHGAIEAARAAQAGGAAWLAGGAAGGGGGGGGADGGGGGGAAGGGDGGAAARDGRADRGGAHGGGEGRGRRGRV